MSAGVGAQDAAWTRAAELGSSAGIRLMAWIHLHLGRGVTHVLLVPVVAYFCLRAGEARRASRHYFAQLARHAPEDLPPRPWLGRTWRHFHTFASLLVDRLCFWSGHYEEFEVEIHGREAMEPLLRAGQGAVLLGAHAGSFDVLRVLARDAGIRVNAVMFTGNARRINQLLESLDPASTLRVIEMNPSSVRTGFEIRACVERGEFVALLADRVAPGETRGRVARVPFLGADAPFPEGPVRLPLLLGLPIVLCVALRRSPRRYDVFLERLDEGVQTAGHRGEVVRVLLERFASRLERLVRLEPYQWFNFYDFWQDGSRP